MTYTYCTCRDKKSTVLQNSTGFRLVEIKEDGSCIHCGYYAISTNKPVKDKAELYEVIRNS